MSINNYILNLLNIEDKTFLFYLILKKKLLKIRIIRLLKDDKNHPL